MAKKRIHLPWWPVSAQRKRALQKRGVLCKWSADFNAYVRRNPLKNEDGQHV